MSEEEIEDIEENYWRKRGRESFDGAPKRLPTLLRSRKRFGQHFLEPVWVAKVIRAIDPQPDDNFLEIGPGRGALTRPLLEKSDSVLAFEIDRDLAAGLRDLYAGNAKLTVVEGDFLEDGQPARRTAGHARSASPATFPTTSRRRFSSSCSALHASGVPLVDATLMLQREVADRLVARPGGKEYGVLSILVQHDADVERAARPAAGRVPAGAEGAVGAGPRPVSGAASASPRSGPVRRARPGHLHAPAQDAGECPTGFPLSSRLSPAVGARTGRASTAGGGPRR